MERHQHGNESVRHAHGSTGILMALRMPVKGSRRAGVSKRDGPCEAEQQPARIVSAPYLISVVPDPVAVAVNAVLLAAYAGSLAAVMAEQFPAEVRTAGISLPYGIAVAVFGGLTPVLATASLQHDVFWIFQAAMVALCLISAAVFWRMPETSGT